MFTNPGGCIADVIARFKEVTFRPVERRLAAFLLSRTDDTWPLQATHQEKATDRKVV